jgi:CRP-like cAMP-binding protein
MASLVESGGGGGPRLDLRHHPRRGGFSASPAPDRDDIAAILLGFRAFAGLPASDLAALAERTHLRHYDPGEVIFKQGGPEATIHFIRRGLVKLYVASPKGQDVVLTLLHAREFFGELSFIDGLPRPSSAAALAPTETVEIGRDDFFQVVKTHPRTAEILYTVLASRLRKSYDLITETSFLDVKTRVVRRLLELSDAFGKLGDNQIQVDVPLRQADLAAFAGTTRETLNRILAGMEREGLLSFHHGKITIKDLARLAAIART